MHEMQLVNLFFWLKDCVCSLLSVESIVTEYFTSLILLRLFVCIIPPVLYMRVEFIIVM